MDDAGGQGQHQEQDGGTVVDAAVVAADLVGLGVGEVRGRYNKGGRFHPPEDEVMGSLGRRAGKGMHDLGLTLNRSLRTSHRSVKTTMEGITCMCLVVEWRGEGFSLESHLRIGMAARWASPGDKALDVVHHQRAPVDEVGAQHRAVAHAEDADEEEVAARKGQDVELGTVGRVGVADGVWSSKGGV